METKSFRIGIIGVGGFGARTAYRVSRSVSVVDDVDLAFYAVDTDEQTLPSHDSLLLSLHLPYLVHGTCDGQPILGRFAALHYEKALFGDSTDSEPSPGLLNLERNSIAIVVTGIGGGAGSGIAPIICQHARKSSITVGIACMPLDNAPLKADPKEALTQLRNSADVVFVVDPNYANFGVRSASDTDRLAWAEEQAVSCVARLVSAIGGDGLIGLDFLDILNLFKGSTKSYYGFGTAEANMENSGKTLTALTRSMTKALDQHYGPGLGRKHERVKGGLICFSYPRTVVTVKDVHSAAQRFRFELGEDKAFIFQAILDDRLLGVRTDVWLTT